MPLFRFDASNYTFRESRARLMSFLHAYSTNYFVSVWVFICFSFVTSFLNATLSCGKALKDPASKPNHLLGVAVRVAIGSGHLAVMTVGGGGMGGKLRLLLLLTGAQFGCRALIDV